MKKKELEELLKVLLAENKRLAEENERLAEKLAEENQFPIIKEKEAMTSPGVVARYFIKKLGKEKREHFYALFLDTKNKLLREELISLGSLDLSIAHPREVFRGAILNAAKNIIVLHNHPSGDPTPSEEDINLTKRLKKVGDLIGIEVLDHIIIGEDSYYSFSEARSIPL